MLERIVDGVNRRSARSRLRGVELRQRCIEPNHAAADCALVALGFYCRTEQLQVDEAFVSSRENQLEAAAQGEVGVAGDLPVGLRQGADDEVTHLNEIDEIYVVAQCFAECSFE